MADTRLTLADQVLVWAGLAMTGPYHDPADARLFSGLLAEVLPHVSVRNPYIARIATAAEDAIAASDAADDLRLAAALKDFARWRAGLSFKAFEAGAERKT